jgi:hypothetical protein
MEAVVAHFINHEKFYRDNWSAGRQSDSGPPECERRSPTDEPWDVSATPNYGGVFKNFRTGRLQPELQMIELSATRYSFIAIFSVSLVSFSAITLCVASQRVFIVVSVYLVTNSVRKLLNTSSCINVTAKSVYQSVLFTVPPIFSAPYFGKFMSSLWRVHILWIPRCERGW